LEEKYLIKSYQEGDGGRILSFNRLIFGDSNIFTREYLKWHHKKNPAGEILVQLSNHWSESQFFGYELSPQGFELCKKRAPENILYFNEDFFEHGEQKFDLVLCIDVLEHIEDYFTFLRRLRTKGQHFIFHIPLDMNVQMVLRNAPINDVREWVGHLHYFSKDTALAVLKDCRYSIVS
jgi:hypothetical protein